MSLAVKSALEGYLNNNVDYNIFFENVPFTPTDTYIQVDYEQDAAYRKTIGGLNNIEELGTFYIYCYTKKDIGRFEMDNMISELIGLFSEEKIGEVTTYIPQIISPKIVGERYRGGIRCDVVYRTTY